MDKRRISFMDIACFYDLHLGFLLIEAKTGVEYENQVGGHSCHQARIEGYAIPICESFSEIEQYFTGPKYGGWCVSGIDADDANYIDNFLKAAESSARVDRQRISNGMEAWIPISFEGETGFLIWSNSD